MIFPITRRKFLIACVTLMCFGNTRQVSSTNKKSNSDLAYFLTLLLPDLFYQKDGARIIGQQYLKHAPREADINVLLQFILPGRVEQFAKMATEYPKELGRLILLRQRQDFVSDRIVSVRGWIFSETEARLFALAALT